MITKQEFHKSTNKNLTEVLAFVKSKGYDAILELTEGEWLVLHLMNGGTPHMKAMIRLYKKKDGIYEYEISSDDEAEYNKLRELFK